MVQHLLETLRCIALIQANYDTTQRPITPSLVKMPSLANFKNTDLLD